MIYFEVGEPYNSESSQFILPIGEKNKQPTIDSLKGLYKSDWKKWRTYNCCNGRRHITSNIKYGDKRT